MGRCWWLAVMETPWKLDDPATGTWSFTGDLNQSRTNCTANLLNNGEVLVAGGYVGDAQLASAELYDPGIRGRYNREWPRSDHWSRRSKARV